MSYNDKFCDDEVNYPIVNVYLDGMLIDKHRSDWESIWKQLIDVPKEEF